MAKKKKIATLDPEPMAPVAPEPEPVPEPEPDFVWLTSMGDPASKQKRKHVCNHKRARILSVGGVQYEYVGDEDGHRVYRNQTR